MIMVSLSPHKRGEGNTALGDGMPRPPVPAAYLAIVAARLRAGELRNRVKATMITSQSLLLVGPGHLVWVAEPGVPLGAHDVLIRTSMGAISVGAEVPLYQGIARHSQPIAYPKMTGYESVGVVVDCGDAVSAVRPSDRVVGFYGHRTQWVTDAAHVIPIPTGVPDAVALLAILTGDVAKGIRKLAPDPAAPVVITGAGAIGLLTLFMLRSLGSLAVTVIEPLPARQQMAWELGATAVWHPDEAASVADRFPVGFECSSANTAFLLLQQRMQPGGRICILADGNREPLYLAPEFHEHELQIVASSDGEGYPAHAAWFFQEVLRRDTHLERLFDLHITAAALPTTFAQMACHEIAPIKVLVQYPLI